MRAFLWTLVFSGIFLATGCASDETANMSARPWNQPKGWENGLPPAFTEGR